VHLQIAEVSLTKLQRLGMKFPQFATVPNAEPNSIPANGNAQPFSAFNVVGSEIQQVLKALCEDKLAEIIAEPTLVTLSGETAVFTSGNELSAPKRQQDDSVVIEHQPRTVVKRTPLVLDDKVHLAMHIELANLDPTNMVQVGNETMPAGRRSL
jgi:pilus assembly protein CpaC